MYACISRVMEEYMKNIVWTRIDDRLIHGQVMTQWIQSVSYTHLDVYKRQVKYTA